MSRMNAPDPAICPAGDDWVGLTTAPLPVAKVLDWAVRPYCGAVVAFSGTVRDHAEGRPGVVELEYEAYAEQVGPRLGAIVGTARDRWPDLGRLAILHRVGELAVGETSVVVVASTPHRAEAFAAARFCIDTVKTTLPIWKRESWEGGSDWSLGAHQVDEVEGTTPV
ncbi:MAG: molybdopterin synthase [Acidimicrobiales bacterium]|nr:MAG: molybdopterin synthase [Acidimicrobiales bacterium]